MVQTPIEQVKHSLLGSIRILWFVLRNKYFNIEGGYHRVMEKTIGNRKGETAKMDLLSGNGNVESYFKW